MKPNFPPAVRAVPAVWAVRLPRPRADSSLWLVGVAAAYSLAQLLFVPPRLGLGSDETIYVSQVAARVPSSAFSAPRARGISVLVAPIASVTDSTTALRIYLSILSGLGLLAALMAWRGLRPAWVIALAGTLFGGLWVTQFYGPQAMPNLWVAFSDLAAAGCFVRVMRNEDPLDDQVRRGRRAAMAGLAVSLAAAALVRPSDAMWLALPMVAATVIRRPPHWPALAAVAGGLAAGSAEWIIEAYVRFGGLIPRIHQSSQAEGNFGLHFALPDELRALNGPTLCRPCTAAWKYPELSLWWFVLPLLAVLGVIVSSRASRSVPARGGTAHSGRNPRSAARGKPPQRSPGGTPAPAMARRPDGPYPPQPSSLIPALCALSAALPYVFLIGYAAPRFLLPTYALVSIPVADGLAWLISRASADLRPVVISLVTIGIVAQLGVQHLVLDRTVHRTMADHTEYTRLVADLRRLGIEPPCLLSGNQATPVAYYARCSSAQISGTDKSTTPAGILRAAKTEHTAVLEPPGHRPPPYARHWREYPLAGTRVLKLAAYRAPW